MLKKVLVIDDSPVDRQLVGGLLRKAGGLDVSFAEDGAMGIEMIGAAPPDLVITDMVMPYKDGLEVVSFIKQKFRRVPVILMTSQGNEEIAVKALHLGAAGYVPKRMLSDELANTARRSFALVSQQRSHAKLMRNMLLSECAFELENDISLIPPLVGYLQTCVALAGLCDDSERLRIGVALEEALLNAIHHGNLEVSSELREIEDGAAYFHLAEDRSRQAPYMHRRVRVEANVTRQVAKFVVRDEGPGFDPESLPDPTDPANLERPCGRGVAMMRFIMDEVHFNAGGTEVVMIKQRDNDEDPELLPADS